MIATTVFKKQYVEWRDKSYWIKESRVSLDSVVYAFLNGTSPEGIVQSFPVLTLEQVYGAVTFYLANREVVNHSLKEGEAEFEKMRQATRQQNTALYEKLEAAREKHK